MKHVLPYALIGGFLLFSLLTIFSGSAAEGDQEVLRIDFSGLSGTTEGPLTGIGAAGIENVTLSRGPGLAAASANNAFNSNRWAVTEGNFLSLTFDVVDGQALQFGTLTFEGQASATGPRDMAVFSSADGFATPVATWTQAATAATQRLDLSALAPVRGSVTLRFMPISTTSANGNTIGTAGSLRFANASEVNGLQLTGLLIGQEDGASPEEPSEPETGEPMPEEPGTPGDVLPDPEENNAASIFWDLTGQPGNQAFTPGAALPASIIVFDLERSESISATAANNSINANGFNTEEERFFTFGFRVPEGLTFTGEKLLLTTRSSAAGPGNLVVQSSVDGYSNPLAEITQTTNDFIVSEIDLSALGALSGEVRFRVAAVGQTAASGNSITQTGTLRIANTRLSADTFEPLRITGILSETDVLPEPAGDPVALLQYDLAGQPGGQASNEALVLVSGISGQPLTRGAGLGTAVAANSISSNGWNAGEERFFRFGFTALPGQRVDLSSLRFGYRSSNTGPTNMALRYSGDNFTQNLATFTSVNAFGNIEVDLSALQGLTGAVEFRVVALDNTSANGGTVAAGGTFRLTNFFPGDQPITFTGIVRASGEAGIPFISTDPEALSFPRTSIREDGPVLSYTLSARDLAGPVEISGPEALRFSLEGSNFQAPLSIPEASFAAGPVTVFVQLSSSQALNLASSIQHSTSGIPPVSLTVSGQRFDPFQIFEDFNTSCQEGLPDGWTAIAITGQQLWECTQFGRAGNNATANAPFGLQANGFANGTQQTNEQWLISPAFDLSEFNFPLLSFWTRVAFAGPRLELFIAQDYSGDPQTATWVALDDRFATENFWTFSQEIDLSNFKEAPVHLAFRYRSSPEEGAARWTLDDFSLVNSDTPPAPFLNVGIGNVDYTHFGITPEGTVAPKRYSFPVTLSNAIEPLHISAAPGFEFSLQGENNFSPVLILSPEQARTTKNIDVRFAPAFAGAFSSVIQFRSGDIEERAGFLTGATVKRKDSFDVVTWNIEWFGSEASGQGPANTQRQLENVKKILEDLDADVYAFQEITSIERFNQLVEALPDYRGFISPAVSQVGDFADAQKLTFLYKTSTVDSVATRVLLEGVQESDLVGYPSNPNRFWASGRLPFLFEVETKINGVNKRINLVNIHARSNGGGESAGTPRYAMRKYDVGVLKDSLDTYYPDVPLLILGDYNDDLDETVADQNAPTVNTSETSFIRFIEDEENYTPVTLSLSQAGLRSFIARENVIDHIMISNELDQAWIVQSERVVAPFDLVPDYASSTSDHLPVKARFLLECTLIPGEISSEGSSFCVGETVELSVPESTARLQWQRLDADNNWQDIPDATEATFSFTFEENASYRVRFADDNCEVFSAPVQVQAAEDCTLTIEEQVFGNPPLRIAPRLEEGQRFLLLSLDEGVTTVHPENREELVLIGAGQALAEVQIFQGEQLLRTLPISFRVAPATLSIIVEEGQFKFEGEGDPVFTFFAEGFVAPDTEAILSGTLERAPGEAPGRYLISQGSLSAGPNYAIAFTPADFEIREAEEVVVPELDPIEKVRNFIAGAGEAPTQADYAALDHILQADQVAILNTYLLIVGSPTITEEELAAFVAELIAFRDTDGDEVPDIIEIIQGTDPLDPADYLDSDGDLVPDFVEDLQGTDPMNALDFLDSNGDGVPDYVRARAVLTLMELEPVQLDWGVTFDASQLPSQVVATFGNGSLLPVPVLWEVQAIDPFQSGSTFLMGTLKLPRGLFNAYALEAMQEVRILAKPAPRGLSLSSTSFPAGSSLELVGSLIVDDPSDDVHALSLVEGALDNRLFALQDQQLFWNSAEPFPGQNSFEVRIQVLDRDGNTLTEDFTIERSRIALADMEIFTAFTPNGDGINDTWGVRDLRFYEDVQVQVFDNSGRRLFLSRDPNHFWDGTSDGRTLPVGTYYYVIRVGETGEIRKGFITLLKQ